MAQSRARRTVVDSSGLVADVTQYVQAGCSIFAINRGQWSMVDVMRGIAREHGGASVSLWAWTVAAGAVQFPLALCDDNYITTGRLVLHAGAVQANVTLVAAWQQRFGLASVSLLSSHSKVARVACGDGLRVLIRGSMSMNFIPYFEQCDITEGGEDYAMIEALEETFPVAMGMTDVDTAQRVVYPVFRAGATWSP